MSCVRRISVITIWTIEPWMKTSALLFLRFQALAEALKTNSSVANIALRENKIGAEGAKAWCVGWAPLNRWMLRHVMMSLSHTFPDFPGILWQWQVWMVWRCWSFVIHGWSRRLLRTCIRLDGEWKCGFLGWLPLFAKFRIREIHMFELNVFFSYLHIFVLRISVIRFWR